ncbi:ribonuclease Y [Candidatus Aerophobetes bacterium]|uniref:Ribonuclease Y n=1 Tax=Aerophobetes bacterium TaxID=2030807 RepID=A0A523RWE1_UNCAE|nr:MAG: ribonuclease Y [Candidatus Aerophobetes bacterium]
MSWGILIVVSLGLLVIGGLVGSFVRKMADKSRVKSAEDLAKKIVEDAKKEAKTLKKEADLQAKDSLLQTKVEFEKESRDKRREFQKLEKRILQREESLDKKVDLLDRKENELSRRDKALSQKEKSSSEKESRYNILVEEAMTRLEKLSGITSTEAKRQLLEMMKNETKHEAAKMIKQVEEEAKEQAEKNAKKIIGLAVQKYAGDYAVESSVSVVNLPNDEMKGRIIGREGRNIRTIEAATGVDLIIDDTPGAVVLSGHNPIRREVAKIVLERLIADGRIHPGRIEEVVEKANQEVEASIKEAGDQAAFDIGVHGIHPEVIRLIGRLKYRTSYSQNVYQHSLEVSFICGTMAAELGLNIKQAKRAGLLHDIGKAVDYEVEGSHSDIGRDLAKKYGEPQEVIEAIGGHHDDTPPSLLAILVQAADALSGARPGARREMLETYVKRLEDLERIANLFSGVEKSYAIQAGRELRVIVKSDKVSDEDSVVLSKEIAKKVESELSYPGQVKVTVIRETRAVEYAK